MLVKKVLTIDDDQDINNFLKLKIEKHHLKVETASEIEEFFKKVLEFKPALCLVDLNLGAHTGFGYKIIEMMRKKIGPEIIIIVMSRRDAIEDINKALDCGANDYIQKPLDEDILISKINVFLDEHTEEVKFPYYAVPTGDTECVFNLPLRIHSLSEEYLNIFSTDYIAKGSLLVLESEFFSNIPFLIKDVTFDREAGGYIIQLVLDPDEHANLLPAFRRMLIQSKPV